jgi:cytidylate kinase
VIIAIDGPAGSGKSTIAQKVARRLGMTYLDTGAMYRAVTLLAMEQGVSMEDDAALGSLALAMELDVRPDPSGSPRVFLGERDVTDAIRTPAVSQKVSLVAAHQTVRRALTRRQRRLASKGDMVLEGRDIGTDVFPDAQYKFYLDASVEMRAQRRLRDLEKAGVKTTLEEVMADVKARDDRDMNRAVGGLRKTADSIVMDHSELTVEQSAEELFQYIRRNPR